MNYALIISSIEGLTIAQRLSAELGECTLVSTHPQQGGVLVSSLSAWVREHFSQFDCLIFIGAVGIATRCIAPCLQDKYQDPAVINVDATARYVIPLLSGHVGGANACSKRIAHILGAQPVITTQSDLKGLWALDTLGAEYGWTSSYARGQSLNEPIAHFVNQNATALLLDIRDRGCDYLERTAPDHVQIFYRYEDIPSAGFDLLIAVTPFLYPQFKGEVLYYHPPVLHLGMGCRQLCPPEGVADYLEQELEARGLAQASLRSLSSIELKKDEPLLHELAERFQSKLQVYAAEELNAIATPNQSEKVHSVTGTPSVSEAAAILTAQGGGLLIEKQKHKLQEGGDFTYAVAIQAHCLRQGHVEIVGAGPGDPELISVRGKHFLQRADLILYAGSLVPIELTYYAKEGATVRSSAAMDLDEQFTLMHDFYKRGLLVVRLHTGDPCIYGAIQEQMAYFDQHGMSYHITPGISSFLAAAAALRSQFTIPERVQSIILTRGEGRTPMPDKEKLSLLARSQSTMCIFLSVSIVEQVQRELLEHYPPTTPVAVCYKLTWKDERIFRGCLQDLVSLVKDNKLTLTTMIVVGEAIDNREGLSRLYHPQFHHLFRP